MTGTGTQADPYIVDTWPDFVTAAGTSGAYVEAAPGLTWDMNDIAPEGVEGIIISCASLKGNGLKIEALRASGYILRTTRSTIISGLRIEGFIGLGLIYVNDASSLWFAVKISDSTFAGRLNGSSVIASNYGTSKELQAERCAVSVKGESLKWCNRINNEFKDSNIYFSGVNISGLNCNNCAVAGAISGVSAQTIYSSSSSINLHGDANVTWGYFSAEAAVSVFNKDMLPNSSGNTNYKVKAVTDAQMRDAAYLESQGFDIGVEP